MDTVDPVIPRRRACREYFFCSPVTAWRRERELPGWPKALLIGPWRFGYRLSDIRAYLESRKPPADPVDPAERNEIAKAKAYRLAQRRRAAQARRQSVAT